MITRFTYLNFIQKVVLFLALLFVCTSFVGTAAYAQAEASDLERITLSPVSERQQLTPGSRVNDKFTVINDGQVAYEFKVYASPYYVKNEQYEPLFNTQAGQRDASKWVQFEKEAYTLQPNSRVEVPYSILVPQNASPGGHYAVLFAETKAKNSDNTGVGRNKRVGSVLLANVNGEVNRSGNLVDDATSFLQLTPPLSASLRVRNNGNIDFDAKVALQVKDIFGKEKHKSENTFVIFPDTTRRTVVTWNDAPAIGLFKVNQSVEFLGKTQSTSKYVLIIPSWTIIGLTIGLVAGIGSLVLKRRSGSAKR